MKIDALRTSSRRVASYLPVGLGPSFVLGLFFGPARPALRDKPATASGQVLTARIEGRFALFPFLRFN
ncbi:hypothetical protein [Sulfitobacter sp. G21635-S1]|jgi:hypothetical protein|uniref:hypothetical protein n=1 Tax=Sulfitobacter sp. G21635-S1 TaxID=3014043 RepID=UPI0022AE6832|nr:hypothetical protein [Sulfitobacter sp. G21635-S1]